MNTPQLQITPHAILAAVLFYGRKQETLKVVPDDSTQEVEVVTDCVNIESDGDALVALIGMDKILEFATQVYDFRAQIDGPVMLISFEKRAETSGLVSAGGQAIVPQSSKIQELIGRLK